MGLENQRQSPFSTWLRTGRILVSEERPDVERKFNGWHDPANGRFTFVGTGRYFPSGRASISARSDQSFRGGGGGAGFVGGGADGGGWPAPGPGLRALSSTRRAIPPARNSPSAMVAVATQAQVTRGRRAGQPWRRVMRNGYEFQIDENNRTRRVAGTLRLGIAGGRSRRAQSSAGGSDRRRGDDGGHYIAHRFNGPSDAFNHFAQAANFNRGRYRALEEEWARARRSNRRVIVVIVPSYNGLSRRPSAINVWYTIDGERKSQRFPNESGR
jgi:hypothetical protein